MITYSTNTTIFAEQFIDVLHRSTLAQRRPVDDKARIQTMLDQATIIITAWHNTTLIGISRALTDHSYCCYLSDLAVDTAYQNQGIGKKLIALTQQTAGAQCALILLSAPAAMDYYPKLGMTKIANGFLMPRAS